MGEGRKGRQYTVGLRNHTPTDGDFYTFCGKMNCRTLVTIPMEDHP